MTPIASFVEDRTVPGTWQYLGKGAKLGDADKDAITKSIEKTREAVAEAEVVQRHAESDVRDQEALLAKLEGQQHQAGGAARAAHSLEEDLRLDGERAGVGVGVAVDIVVRNRRPGSGQMDRRKGVVRPKQLAAAMLNVRVIDVVQEDPFLVIKLPSFGSIVIVTKDDSAPVTGPWINSGRSPTSLSVCALSSWAATSSFAVS